MMEQKNRTPQDYIDETPIWPDGTPASKVPMTMMQWRIWLLATFGKFFEGMVVFATGVALPLMVEEFSLSATQKGFVAAAPLFGILVGASALGGLADHFGRKRMFIIEMILFVVFLLLTVAAPNVFLLVIFLFGLGVSLGCDYPTAHMIISESIPSKTRGQLVLGAFAFQAVGALAGTAIGYFTLAVMPELGAWRWMYGVAIIPAILVVLGRLFITESAPWLLVKGDHERAAKETLRLLKREPAYPKEVTFEAPEDTPLPADENPVRGWKALFHKKYRRSTILASVPWFLQDLGTYGIGIFTPTVLVSLVGEKETGAPHNIAAIVHNDMRAAQGAAIIDVLLILGFIAAIFLAERVGRIKLQVLGFFGCALGLAIAGLSLGLSGTWQLVLVFAGFMIFNFMTNMGPNAMTYLLAGEVFPTHIRGRGAGFAASIAKVGAVLTAFLFPILLAKIGTAALMGILVVTSLLGAWVTWQYRIETRGVNLDRIGEDDTDEPTGTIQPRETQPDPTA